MGWQDAPVVEGWQSAPVVEDAADPSVADEALKGVRRGAINAVGQLADTPQRLYELGKAATGTVLTSPTIGGIPNPAAMAAAAIQQARGKPLSDLMPDPGSTDWASKAIKDLYSRYTPSMEQTTVPGVAQAVGTGADLATQMFAGGGWKAPIMGVAAPAIGGAVGEQVGGETGKLVGMLAPAGVSVARAMMAPGAKAQAANAVRDTNAAEARAAGFTIPPTQTNPTLTNRLLEGASGKDQTGQVASLRNQPVTNQLAARSIGLEKDTPLTVEVLGSVRDKAGQAYQAIKDLPITAFKADKSFTMDINALGKDYAKAAAEFPALAKNEGIQSIKDSLGAVSQKISPEAGIELIKKLRFDASANYKAFNDPSRLALADAQKKAATAIENLIERNLIAGGKGELVDNFRKARTLIAKTYDVEAALNDTTGNVSAQILGRAIQKGKPLTGELRQAGEFANAGKMNVKTPEQMGSVPGVSPLDFATSAIAGSSGGAGYAGIPFIRPAIRSLLLSGPYQRTMGVPTYAPEAWKATGQATLPLASSLQSLLQP